MIHMLTLAAALALGGQAWAASPAEMAADIMALVEAARRQERLVPWEEATAEIAAVARHGRAIALMLAALLADYPPYGIADDPQEQPDWRVQQHLQRALGAIYGLEFLPGTVWGNRVLEAENAQVKPFWLRMVTAGSFAGTGSAKEPLGIRTAFEYPAVTGRWRCLVFARRLTEAGGEAEAVYVWPQTYATEAELGRAYLMTVLPTLEAMWREAERTGPVDVRHWGFVPRSEER